MLPNPDTSKQTQEIVFSRKKNVTNHGTIYFNNMPFVKGNVQKYLCLLLDVKLNFLEHIIKKIKKANKVLMFYHSLRIITGRKHT